MRNPRYLFTVQQPTNGFLLRFGWTNKAEQLKSQSFVTPQQKAAGVMVKWRTEHYSTFRPPVFVFYPRF
jgi:hypothetical protein